MAAEPSQRSRARAWRPEWCPHEHTNSPTDRGGARHRDLRPRPDEGWNRAEAASSRQNAAGLHPLRISLYARAAGSRDTSIVSVSHQYNTSYTYYYY